MNVDQVEVQKFEDMSAYWWDKQGPCKPLHDLNPLRLQFIQERTPLYHRVILDIGCGGGILTEALSAFSNKVTGLDQSPGVLQAARAHAVEAGLTQPPTYVQACAEDYAKQYPGQFDVITCMELLEHVPSPISILKACFDLLRPGGSLFLSTLNRTPKSFLHAIIGAEYVLKMLPKGTHDYNHFIRPSELNQWAMSEQLHLQSMKGLSFNILTRTFYLSDDVSVNYLMHLQKDAG